jgi:hypothetical protein
MKKYDVDLFLNTNYQKTRRLEMLKGVRHQDCSGCWQIEDKGSTSLRGNGHNGFMHFANQRSMFDEFPNQTMEQISENVTIENAILESHRPFMLEVSLGNNCDMKCMYCNHVYSSQWATESLKNNTITHELYKQSTSKPDSQFLELFWKWVDLEAKHSVERIGIIGGEPLITPEFYEFLDRLLEVYEDVSHNNTTIWIVTNLNSNSTYFNRFMEYIPKLLTKFKLEILISMESTGNRAEYIRNGLDWNKFEKNVHNLVGLTKDKEEITLGFLPSITALSVPRFHNFLKWVYDISIKYNKPIMLKQNIVTWPTPHTPFILPGEFSVYLDAAIVWMKSVQDNMPNFKDEFGRWTSYTKFLINLRNSIRNNTSEDIHLKKQFYSWFKNFDEMRGLNFCETFPELAEFYNNCKELN